VLVENAECGGAETPLEPTEFLRQGESYVDSDMMLAFLFPWSLILGN
jgi:hypothetical protein